MLYEPSARTFHCITRNSEVFPSETFSSLLQLMKVLSSKGGNLWRALSRSFRASFRALSWQEPAVIAAMMLTRYTIVIKFELSNTHQQSPLTANGRSSIHERNRAKHFHFLSRLEVCRHCSEPLLKHASCIQIWFYILPTTYAYIIYNALWDIEGILLL